MTATVDLILIGSIVGSMTAISVPLAFFIRCYYRITTSLKENTKAIEASKKERRVLLQGVLACLGGLQEHGCDGTVKQGITDINAYMINELHDENEGKG